MLLRDARDILIDVQQGQFVSNAPLRQ